MSDEPSVFRFLGMVVRRWRLLVVLPLVVAAIVVAYGLARRQYVSESRFLPTTTNSDQARLSGLAAQFGFNIGGGDKGESIDFYAALLRSRELLLAAATTTYAYVPQGATDSVRTMLLQVLKLGEANDDAAQRRAVRALRNRVSVSTDTRAGMVVLKVVMPSRDLAELVNRRLLVLVNEFNLQKRQLQASAERRFSEQRAAEALHELEGAEADLRRFTERNRVADDPGLRLESARLQRRVDLRQQVYTSLVQSFEQARLAEVRNTPLVSVVDAPERSAESTVRLVFSAGVGLVLGFFLALGAIMLGEYFDRHRVEYPEDYEQVRSLARQSMPFRARKEG